MTLLSMRFRQRITRVFGAVFLLGALLGLSGELVLAQWKVDDLGRALSSGALPALLKRAGPRHELGSRLERYRVSMGFERVELFDEKGRKLAESPSAAHGEGIHGVLASARAGIRASGREVAHLLVWRNMEAEVVRPLLIGLIAGLIAALIAWPIVSRMLAEEQAG